MEDTDRTYVRVSAASRKFNESSASNPVANPIFVPLKSANSQAVWRFLKACTVHSDFEGESKMMTLLQRPLSACSMPFAIAPKPLARMIWSVL